MGNGRIIDENALQVNLTRLKKTMANLDMPQQIIPVRGVGYRLSGRRWRGKNGTYIRKGDRTDHKTE